MKKKITFLDLIIVAVILVVVVVGISMLGGNGSNSLDTVKYKVLIADQLPEVAQQIVVEDDVVLDPKENVCGNVIAVESKPCEDTYLDLKNERYVSRITENRMDVYVTVEAQASVSNFGWKIGAQDIKIGEHQSISANTYGVEGYIIDILN